MTEQTVGLLALDVPIDVDGLRGEDAERFRALWRPCVTRPGRGALRVRVSRTAEGWRGEVDRQVTVLPGADAAVGVASAAVNALATARTPLLATHAAVLTRGGLTLVAPGLSGSGKTTLSLALMRLGWSYVSDEALALDPATGAVRPYARPAAADCDSLHRLGLEDAGTQSAGERFLVPADLGASYDLKPYGPSLVVLRDRDLSQVGVSAMHRMDGLEALLRRSFTTHRDPTGALRRMARLVRGCEVVRLSGDDPLAAAAALSAAVG